MTQSKATIRNLLLVYLGAFFLFMFGFHEKAESQETQKPEILTKKKAKKISKKKGIKKMYAVFETSKGTFKAELFHKRAPNTVDNFVSLAKGNKEFHDPIDKVKVTKPFYDDTIFHRVIKNFVIQGGDRTGTGLQGPGYTIQDEFHAELLHEKPGTLAMARTQAPNSAGSQFYITTEVNSSTRSLDGSYAVFGRVIDGMDVVTKIASVKTNRSNDKPLEDVKLISVKIIEE